MNLFQILADSTDFCESAAGYKLFGFAGHILRIIQIAIPIIIILMGSIDLVKAIISQKDDEMKKAQSILIKRLLYGVIIFFVPIIANFVVNLVGGDTTSPCLTCFLDTPGDCVETGNNMSGNAGTNINGMTTEEPQTEEEAKEICEKCEAKGSTCATLPSGNKYCDDGSPSS